MSHWGNSQIWPRIEANMPLHIVYVIHIYIYNIICVHMPRHRAGLHCVLLLLFLFLKPKKKKNWHKFKNDFYAILRQTTWRWTINKAPPFRVRAGGIYKLFVARICELFLLRGGGEGGEGRGQTWVTVGARAAPCLAMKRRPVAILIENNKHACK